MGLRVSSVSAIALLVAGLAGCGRFDGAQRPAWRDRAEDSCIAQHLVEASPVLQPAAEIDGPGICGLHHPFRVYALAGGTVRLNTASILDCPMIPMLDIWIKEVIQPDAQARFGEPVVEIKTMGTYACRGINNQSGAGLSEHAFGNAMDVGGFVLASGRELNVMRGWSAPDIQESAFLHDAHAGACGYFTTVLGPGYNVFHYNHMHLDLAMRGNTSRGPRRACKPVPETQIAAPKRDDLPDPPGIEEEMDIAQTPIPGPSYRTGSGSTFVASVPETSPIYHPKALGFVHQAAPSGTGVAGRPVMNPEQTQAAEEPPAPPPLPVGGLEDSPAVPDRAAEEDGER